MLGRDYLTRNTKDQAAASSIDLNISNYFYQSALGRALETLLLQYTFCR